MTNLEQSLSLGQKVSGVLFVLLVIVGSMDVAEHGFLGFSPLVLSVSAAALGALTALLWIKRRYRVAGVIGGTVAGLTGVWFTIWVITHSETNSKLTNVGAAFLGMLPGLGVFLLLKWVQDRLSAPRRDRAAVPSPEEPRRGERGPGE